MISIRKVKPGVYDTQVLSHQIRIPVLSELPLNQRNAVLAFFSFDEEKVKYALKHYQWQLKDIPQLINQVLQKYMLEGLNMPYTMEDFRREYILAYLPDLPVEDRLKGLGPKERLKGLSPDDIFSLFDQKEIEAFLRKHKKDKHSRRV